MKEEDYSKPAAEINYEVKKRGKRRRGEAIEEEYPKKKHLAPYKREHLNFLVEDEHDAFDDAVEDGWYDFPDDEELYYDSLRDDHKGCTYCDTD